MLRVIQEMQSTEVGTIFGLHSTTTNETYLSKGKDDITITFAFTVEFS